MIVRNEEAVPERCLNAVKSVYDQLVIVDTGSEDMTMSIARRYTDKVYDFPRIDDFSAARNVSYSYASMEYIMWIDADDVVTPEDAAVDHKDMTVHFEAYHEFIPCQKLSKLYALQGKTELAYEYFLRAEKIYPENRSVKLDRLFFSKRSGST